MAQDLHPAFEGCEPMPWDQFHWSIGTFRDPFRVEWAHTGKDWLVIDQRRGSEPALAIVARYEHRKDAREHLVLLRLTNGMNEDGTQSN